MQFQGSSSQDTCCTAVCDKATWEAPGVSRGGGGLAREAAVTSVQRSDSPPLKVVTPICVD